MRTCAFAAALVVLSACGPGPLYVELEVPEIELTLPSQEFPATTPTNACGDYCTYFETGYDLGESVPLVDEPNVAVELRLLGLGITLTANDPMQDFSSLQSVVIAIEPPAGSDLPRTVIASYEKAPGATASVISVEGNRSLDLGEYLAEGSLPLRLEITGDGGFPPAFTADLSATFYAKVSYDYTDDFLKLF